LLRAPEVGRQQLFGDTVKLIGKPSEKPSQEDKPQLPCSHTLYLNETHGTHHKNRLASRLRREVFYWVDGGSFPIAVLQTQSC
jgi:hypothetical protein